jgi:predicted DNA-binding transcriptional regulator YafY
LREEFVSTHLIAPEHHYRAPIAVDMAGIRKSIRLRRKVRLDYEDEVGDRSQRVVRPLALAFYGPVWVMVAWCELRNDFRNFRLDRMVEADIQETRFAPEPGKRLADFVKAMKHHERTDNQKTVGERP